MGLLKGVKALPPRCVYCGRKPIPAKPGWPRVCRLHSDLPRSDPAYPNASDPSD